MEGGVNDTDNDLSVAIAKMWIAKIAITFPLIALTALYSSCSNEQEHMAPPVNDADSVSVMTSYGVNTLISDSGIVKYRIVAEQWDVNTVRNPSRWTFIKGIFMTQFDPKMKVKAYVMADTAWYYDKIKLWHLTGRVKVINADGLVFRSQQLFWDGTSHELWSNAFSKLVTPQRTLAGNRFRSDENMSWYTVSNSNGSFIKSDFDNSQQNDTTTQTSSPDSLNLDNDSIPETNLPAREKPNSASKQKAKQNKANKTNKANKSNGKNKTSKS